MVAIAENFIVSRRVTRKITKVGLRKKAKGKDDDECGLRETNNTGINILAYVENLHIQCNIENVEIYIW